MRDSQHPELIAIGEAMVLVTPASAEPLETADDFRLDVGGAESNVAAHAVRLGHSAAWIGQLGDDMLGRRVARQLRDLGVDLSWLRVDATAPTGVYFKNPGDAVQYYRAGSAASRMSPQTIDGVPLEQATVVHLSGITPALSAGCAALVDAAIERARASDALLSFDVNYRPALWPVAAAAPALLALALRAEVVFVGLDEATTLWGLESVDDVRALLPGVPRVVVKDGEVGATEFSETGTRFEPALATEVVEPVGAGDAFAAGYLSAHIDGAASAERLRAGHHCAALALSSTSDMPSAVRGGPG